MSCFESFIQLIIPVRIGEGHVSPFWREFISSQLRGSPCSMKRDSFNLIEQTSFHWSKQFRCLIKSFQASLVDLYCLLFNSFLNIALINSLKFFASSGVNKFVFIDHHYKSFLSVSNKEIYKKKLSINKDILTLDF